MGLLTPNASVRVFIRPAQYTETDPEFALLPEVITNDAPQSHYRSIVHGTGTWSIGALESAAPISSKYEESLQRPFAASSAHNDHDAIWSRRHLARLLVGPVEEDLMSDTDSDEEDDDIPDTSLEPSMWPTIESSATFFTQDANKSDAVETENDNEEENGKNADTQGP